MVKIRGLLVKTKRIWSVVLAVLLAVTMLLPASAASADEATGTYVSPSSAITAGGTEDPVLSADVLPYGDVAKNNTATRFGKTDISLFKGAETFAPGWTKEYTFDVAEGGLYEFTLKYVCATRDDLEISVMVDGVLPFTEAARLEFPGHWQNSDKSRVDGAGNQIAPEQELYLTPVAESAWDYTGSQRDNYRFALTAGTHTVTLLVKEGEGTLASAAFTAPEQVAAYQKPADLSGTNNKIITIEGESAFLKTSKSLIPRSDMANASVSPADPVKGKLNYVGGANWSTPGHTLTWNVTVEQAGYYSLATFYRQNIELGAVSYRHLMIDGKTPFAEANNLRFEYDANWQYYTFGGEEDPYLFWLDAGPHTLSMTVTPGDMAEAYSRLQDITNVMGDLYIDITMLVGETVDIYRSYKLEDQIPQYKERMEYCYRELNELVRYINIVQGYVAANDTSENAYKPKSSMGSTVAGAREIVKQMLDQPFSAHKYKTAFYNSYTNLGTLIGSMTNMPLDIDRIFLIGKDAAKPETGVGFFEGIGFEFSRFFATFSDDYNSVSNMSETGESLTLWVNWGRDQAQVLNALVEEGFSQQTGVAVTIDVVNATLIQGMLAGKGPDVMLHMARTEPVNLAMRGAIIDLTQFSDFEQTLDRFTADSYVPYRYKNGVYALPDTQSFSMMFVRTDILADMGLSTEIKTWDDFAYVSTMLQRNNLQSYIPAGMYSTMLAQYGLEMYDLEKGVSKLDGAEQIQVFIEYTDWYTKYKLPKAIDSFFNRFRVGTTPVGIADFTLLTQLETAAPEIAERWSVQKLPGVYREDGTFSNVSAGAGTGCAITTLAERAGNKENAWKFLKWWTSAEVQLGYSSNLESVLGPLGRQSTSNLEAFRELGWGRDIVGELTEQQQAVKNWEELPGGYYVPRGVDQAFWNVVEQNENPTDIMLEWAEIVNNEMIRKQNEYK